MQFILTIEYNLMLVLRYFLLLLVVTVAKIHQTQEAPLIQTGNLKWVKPEQINRGLPKSIEIFIANTTNSPFDSNLTAGYAKFNMNDTNLEFIVKDTNGDALGYYPKTPIEYADAEENLVYAVINGGYFNVVLNTSASFIAQNGKVKSKNSLNEAANKHPTVGAFGLNKNGSFETEWIQSYGENLQTYRFKFPNKIPGPVINKDQGVLWNVKEGIGAGPILMKDAQIITNNVQNFNMDNMINFRHPRSAICTDMNNNLYFVVVDGRFPGSSGLTMPELAKLMQSINCFNAMNLDGGGSTMLYANNFVINRPSDATGPRKVVSAVLIRDRFKKKFVQAAS